MALPLLTDPALIESIINQYFADCDKRTIRKPMVSKGEIVYAEIPEPYTMAGLAYALGIAFNTINHYQHEDYHSENGQNGPEIDTQIRRLIACAKEKIHKHTLNYGLTGVYEPRIVALVLGTCWGYHSEVKDTGRGNQITFQVINYAPTAGEGQQQVVNISRGTVKELESVAAINRIGEGEKVIAPRRARKAGKKSIK